MRSEEASSSGPDQKVDELLSQGTRTAECVKAIILAL